MYNLNKFIDLFVFLSDMCFPRLNGLHQGVVDEHVLLLSLDKAVPLAPEHQLDEKKPIME